MKLYYITNTLNIDNILTSESISPLSVYPQRMFGYNSFESAPLNGKVDLSNSIILFARIPHYRVDSSELECAPMIVEIEDDFLNAIVEDISQSKNGSVYQVKDGRSIALTPANCRILFTDMRGYKMARLKCQDSKCNKWWEYFRMNIVDMDRNLVLDDLLRNISINGNQSPNVDNEILINKKKGLLWGYALGYAKSLPADIAQLRAIQRAIYNNVASVINSGGKASHAFAENIRQLDEQYKNLDPIRNALLEEWDKELSGLEFTEKQITFLNSLDMRKHLLPVYAKLKNYNLRGMVYTGGTMNFGWSQYQEALHAHTQMIINNSLQSRMIDLKLADIFLNSDAGLTVYEKTEKEDIFDDIIRNILLDSANPLTIEQIRIEKSEVVIRFNSIYKERIGENYKQTKTYEYMVGLLNCIQNGESFDPLSNDDALLQNIAAFILKGDSYDEMITYIIEKGIPTFEYATAMWCACTGYVDISRLIILSLSSQDIILSDIYNQVLNLVYGGVSNVKLLKQPQIVSTGSINTGNSITLGRIRDDVRYHQFPVSAQKKIEAAIRSEALVQDKKAFLMILDSFIPKTNEIFKALRNGLADRYSSKDEFKVAIEDISKPFGKKLKDKVRNKRWKNEPYTYWQAIVRAFELEAKVNDPQAFIYILDNTLNPDSEEYQTILSILGVKPDITESKSPNNTSILSQARNLFSSVGELFRAQDFQEKKKEEVSPTTTIHSSLLDDFSWVPECEALISSKTGREQFRKDANYVVLEHINGKSQAEKSNERIIEHLINLLKLKARESKRDYSLAEIKDIEAFLKKKYGIR